MPSLALCSAAIGWGYLAMVRNESRDISPFVIAAAVSGAIGVAVVAARRRLDALEDNACKSPVSMATGEQNQAFDAPAAVFVGRPDADLEEGRPSDSEKLAGNSRA